jgi:hypothetical protein
VRSSRPGVMIWVLVVSIRSLALATRPTSSSLLE